jgi:hypothetical protein
MKSLTEGDYFGELALIYMAPRSASIKAVSRYSFLVYYPRSFSSNCRRICKEELQNCKIIFIFNLSAHFFDIATERTR